MKPFTFYTFLIIAIAMFVCCDDGELVDTGEQSRIMITERKDEADAFMSKYFALIQQEDFESVVQFYSESTLENYSLEDWVNTLEEIHNDMGDLLSYEIEYYGYGDNIGSNPETNVLMTYTTHYSNRDAIEKFALHQSGDTFKIVANDIQGLKLDTE